MIKNNTQGAHHTKMWLWLFVILVVIFIGVFVRMKGINNEAQQTIGFSGEVISMKGPLVFVRTEAYPVNGFIPKEGTTWVWPVRKEDDTIVVIGENQEPDSPEEKMIEIPTTMRDIHVGSRVSFEVYGDFDSIIEERELGVSAQKIIIEK